MSFQNLSAPDRVVRLLLGLLMLWAGWNLGSATEIWPIALRIFAWFPLVTGALGWCPVYALLGLSTGKPKSPPRDR
jgi:Protein of unknown function (DUF2892)